LPKWSARDIVDVLNGTVRDSRPASHETGFARQTGGVPAAPQQIPAK
jgi:hypothetical protein